jgi:hypothetical protein
MLIKKKTLLETRALKGVMMQSPLSIKIRVSSFHTFFFFFLENSVHTFNWGYGRTIFIEEADKQITKSFTS